MASESSWARATEAHTAAAEGLVAAVRALPEEAWRRPVAGGKWTPAEIVQHLERTYDVALRELAGGDGMAVVTRPWQRLLLRATIVRRILRGKGFPGGARSPRELRPESDPGVREEALASFREKAERFEAAAEQARRENAGARISHAYFGVFSVADGVLLCARHVEHHTAQLQAAADD